MRQAEKPAQWLEGLAVVLLTAALGAGFHSHCLAQLTQQHDSDPGDAPLIKTLPGYQAKAPTAESAEGKRLFQKFTCVNCHAIGGKGGCLAPPLDGEGAVRNDEFLLSRLTNSEAAKKKFRSLLNFQPELLPHPRFTPEKARLLVSYLKTLPSCPDSFLVSPHNADLDSEPAGTNPDFKPAEKTKSSLAGSSLYFDAGCAACHSIGKVGGWFGPRLDGIGGRRSRAFIVAHITEPQLHQRLTKKDPDETPSRMPHINLSAAEIQHIADFLLTLPRSE